MCVCVLCVRDVSTDVGAGGGGWDLEIKLNAFIFTKPTICPYITLP